LEAARVWEQKGIAERKAELDDYLQRTGERNTWDERVFAECDADANKKLLWIRLEHWRRLNGGAAEAARESYRLAQFEYADDPPQRAENRAAP
jgi:hypothetical protein